MNLKEVRKKYNKTQEEIAKVLKIKTQTYQNYELKKRKPSIEILILLANFFNITLDELVGREQKTLIETPEKKELLNSIEQLTEIECHKLNVFAQGLIINRVADQKERTLKIIKDIRKEE